jgi:hypothetical protein
LSKTALTTPWHVLGYLGDEPIPEPARASTEGE